MDNDINNTEGLSAHFNRALDYRTGDIVQLGPGGEHSGRIGKIIGIAASDPAKGRKHDLSYCVKLSDHEAISVYRHRIRLVRAAGSDIEEDSRFLDAKIYKDDFRIWE